MLEIGSRRGRGRDMIILDRHFVDNQLMYKIVVIFFGLNDALEREQIL